MNGRVDASATALLPEADSSNQTVHAGVVAILEDMTADWGVADGLQISPTTRLVADLEFASVDIIHLAVAIEEHYKRPRMGFQELLMKDGRYVDDLTVAQLVEFVAGKLAEELS